VAKLAVGRVGSAGRRSREDRAAPRSRPGRRSDDGRPPCGQFALERDDSAGAGAVFRVQLTQQSIEPLVSEPQARTPSGSRSRPARRVGGRGLRARWPCRVPRRRSRLADILDTMLQPARRGRPLSRHKPASLRCSRSRRTPSATFYNRGKTETSRLARCRQRTQHVGRLNQLIRPGVGHLRPRSWPGFEAACMPVTESLERP
jgi:hypothetical protein